MRGTSLMALVGLAACTGPASEPGSGDLVVVTATTGTGTDADGYRLEVDGRAVASLEPSGTATVSDLAPGTHQVRLAEVASNCAVTGANPRQVELPAGEPLEVAFDVACRAVAATLVIKSATTGSAPDPDGYTVSVDGGTELALGTTDSIELPTELGLSLSLLLGDLAPPCSPEEANPLEVAVDAVVTTVVFHVECAGAASGGTILYAGEVRSATHVFGMRSDGTQRVDLTPGQIARNGRWSPDGRRIAFERITDAGSEIWVMDADGRGGIRLGPGEQPAWSPDGSRIAFVQGFVLHVMAADGSGAEAVPLEEHAKDPAWFPGGRALVYSGENRDRCTLLPTFDLVCAWELRAVALDGSNPRTIVPAPDASWAARSPAFSPEGGTIAFWVSSSAFHVLDGDLHLVAPDGTGLSRLEVGPAAVAAFPVWSPDGGTLAFGIRSAAADGFDVALVPRGGGEPLPILSAPGEQLPTSWR